MPLNPKHSNFISRYKRAAEEMLNVFEKFELLFQEEYSLALISQLTADDFVGENDHLDAKKVTALYQFIALVGSTLKAKNETDFDTAVGLMGALADTFYALDPAKPLYSILFDMKR